ncbi:porin family protein [Vreelandella aquamarina]|uniref:porin family protein n=1 Tax=Vreelandella aquamarina TaxID=77097 RepID=UPI00384C2C5A
MKVSAKALVVASALLMSGAAHAQSFGVGYDAGYPQGYVGADAMAWTLDLDGADESFDAVGLRLVAGVKLDEYLAVEFHGATGGSDDLYGLDMELDYLVGGFLKGIVPLSNNARLFGLLGYSEVKLTASGFGLNESGRDDDVSFGAGAEVDVSDSLAISADVTRYLSQAEYDLDAYSVGLRYRF